MTWRCGPKLPLIILLLTTTAFKSFEAADYNIERICKRSDDYTLCKAALAGTETRAVPLAKRSTELARKEIELTLPRLYNMAQGTQNQVYKTRIAVCRTGYLAAAKEFKNVYDAIVPNVGVAAINNIREGIRRGSMAILDCEKAFKTSKPVADCPVSKQNYNVARLMVITRIVVETRVENILLGLE